MPACRVHPDRRASWDAFCYDCASRLGIAGRALVRADGAKGVRRAVERLRAAYASLNTVRRKA